MLVRSEVGAQNGRIWDLIDIRGGLPDGGGVGMRPDRQMVSKDIRRPNMMQSPAWPFPLSRVLFREPLCRICDAAGRVVPATQVDHIRSLRAGGTDALSNLQPACTSCHSRKTATEDGRWGGAG